MSNRKARTRKGDYDVGYGKPPKHTRFKPGQSGNPKGRAKGTRNFKTDLKATLSAPVKIMRDGKPRKVSTQKAALLRLREKALSGDARALDRLVGLAQVYNNEETTAVSGLSDDDAALLELFEQRVQNGLVIRQTTSEESRKNSRTDQAGPSEKRLRSRAQCHLILSI